MSALITTYLSSKLNIAILISLVALGVFVALGFMLHLLKKQAQKSHNEWDDIFLETIGLPLKIAIIYFWVYSLINLMAKQAILLAQLKPILATVPILLVTWFVFRFIDKVSKKINQNKTKTDADFIQLVAKLSKIFIGIVVLLMLAQYFGFSISSILALGGMGGLIIGFAAKDMLANIFGGLMLHIDKPFNTGDWIRAEAHGIEGVVDKIGWRMTKVITFSKNPIYVPNSLFSTVPIETPSRMTNRRIKQTIGVRYNDLNKIEKIINATEGYLKNSTDIDTNRTIIVNLNNFSAYSVDFFIYCFTKTTAWAKFHQIKQKVLLDISQIIQDHQAEIAYPTQIINLNKSTKA